MYAAFIYGSNAFCFDQAERLTAHANDSNPSLQHKTLGL